VCAARWERGTGSRACSRQCPRSGAGKGREDGKKERAGAFWARGTEDRVLGGRETLGARCWRVRGGGQADGVGNLAPGSPRPPSQIQEPTSTASISLV